MDGHAPRQGTGAGHPADEVQSDVSESESDENADDLDGIAGNSPEPPSSPSSGMLSHSDDEHQQRLEQLVAQHIRHPAIKIPKKNCPFDSPDDAEEFLERLATIHEEADIENTPEGYHLRPDQPDYRPYNPLAYIEVGRAKRRVNVALPEAVWKPRIILWLQALEGLTLEMEQYDDHI